jgi:hypothetical protein
LKSRAVQTGRIHGVHMSVMPEPIHPVTRFTAPASSSYVMLPG